MSLRSIDYAMLADNSYLDTGKSDLAIGGIRYSIIDREDDRWTGFQAVAYRREDTREVVIAYRGTEFGREPIKDGLVDVGMVVGGVNAQARASEAFTARVLRGANEESARLGKHSYVTVTGHSLGGTLAEINAAKFGLKGETFNAYGAAGLGLHIPEGGHQVINHVRAGDPVSAASPHFGEVKIYAAQKDVDRLWSAGYEDKGGIHNLRTVLAVDFDAHAVKNFVPGNDVLGQSILAPENEIRYRANHDMIDLYRHDISRIRKHASVAFESRDYVVDHVSRAGQAVVEEARRGAEHVGRSLVTTGEETGRFASHAFERGLAASAVAMETRRHPSAVAFTGPTPPPLRLDRSDHPDHALFEQARAAVYRLDAQHERTPDRLSENLAGSLTVAARRAGMSRIDHVVLSDDASRSYAIQGDLNSPLKRVTEISTELGIAASIDKSSASWRDVNAQQVQAQALTSQQTQQVAPPSSPSMRM